MSRGDRVVASGNILTSMRDNYASYGVDDYYKKVGASYRNPHYPGVRQCLFSWFTCWWQRQSLAVANHNGFIVFDMACGAGEVIVALQEWWQRSLLAAQSAQTSSSTSMNPTNPTNPKPRRNAPLVIPGLGTDTPRPRVFAADPYTAEAFSKRVFLPCASLSFQQIAEGALPAALCRLPDPAASNQSSGTEEKEYESETIEMVICSFALHLIQTPSELFALLWELSTKCRWLVILAPHKKPEIKDGWGWVKWDIASWKECRITDTSGEILSDRVHCRIYKSVNITGDAD
ncbi:hypothetical protein FA95DRAFT_1486100 [Auriscalpium vulgare]|uniref:Uncharacterized protein n=1 Tax=Auriscalpium vulgare TaxID=40419 RepID=A0ACB8S5H3_9AGAM|nr:hypothetical protein FA95DRAFT_1486100 [Auriscalpium vulgare]